MSTSLDWRLEGAGGEPIRGSTHLPAGAARGALLIVHGFKGYKDYGFLPALGRAAAEAGLVAHRFNLSHAGVGENPARFERPDLFEADTLGKQIHDIATVAAAAGAGELPGPGGRPACWFGHSRGGAGVLLAAWRAAEAGAEAPFARAPVPAGLITAAAPCDACRLSEEEKRVLRREGRLPSPSARTGQQLHVGRGWLEEIERDPDAFDPLQAAANLQAPVLVIHGERDETVSPEDADRIATAAGPSTRILKIAGAGHTFNAPNPLEGEPPPATAEMIEATLTFARDVLAARRANG